MSLSNAKTAYKVYSPLDLEKLNNKNHTQLFLKFLYGNISEGTVNMPYVSVNSGHMCRGSKKYGLYRNFVVNDLASAYKKIYDYTDSYTSVNVFRKGADSNTRANIKYINSYFVDLDVCHNDKSASKTKIATNKGILKAAIDKAIDNKLIPTPSLISESGRGYHLYYKLANPIDTDNYGEVNLFNAVYNEIFVKTGEALGKAFLNSIDSEVDTSVKNCDRICRVPGTKNTKADSYCRIISMGMPYELDDIIKAFGINKNALALSCTNSSKKSTPNKNKATAKPTKPKTKSNVAEPKNAAKLINIAEIIEFPETTKKVKCVAISVLNNILEPMLTVREWEEGDHRERYIFLWYNTCKTIAGAKLAYEKIKEVNDSFKEPLSASELDRIKANIDYHYEAAPYYKAGHGDSIFSFMPETVVGKEWLNLSANEIDAIGYVPCCEKVKKGNENQEQSRRRDIKIAELYLNKNYGYKRITKELAGTEYECSVSTVRYTINRLNIKERKCSLSDVNFGPNARFSRKTERVLGVLTLSQLLSSSFSFSSQNVLNSNVEEEIKEQFKLKQNIMITGAGGTGKSFLLNDLRNLKAKGTYITICPTNSSKVLVNGMTFEKAFNLDVREKYVYKPNDKPSPLAYSKYADVDTIFVDEISMFRNDKFRYLVNIVKAMEKDFKHKIQLVLFGDFCQTPPVITSDERKEFERYYGKYCSGFIIEDISLMKVLNLKNFVLTKNYRASEDEEFAYILNELRYGRTSILPVLKRRRDDLMKYAEDGNKLIHLVSTVYMQNKINNTIITRHLSDKSFRTFRAKNYHKYSECKEYIQVFNGMPVIFTKNIDDKFTKGTLGVVEEVFEDSVKISIQRNGNTYYRTLKQIQVGYGKVSSNSTMQLPFEPAFAITVHKAQGLTLNKVVIHAGMFTAGQLYVAASRVRHLKDIYVVGKLHGYELICNKAAMKLQAA